MKKVYFLILITFILILSGCGKSITSQNTTLSGTIVETNKYVSKQLIVEFPRGYQAEESGGMIIVSSPQGKIIIDGFTPAIGHPDKNEKDFPFQMITYSKDPKMESDAIPAALYYENGDKKTEKELFQILKTVKKLP